MFYTHKILYLAETVDIILIKELPKFKCGSEVVYMHNKTRHIL